MKKSGDPPARRLVAAVIALAVICLLPQLTEAKPRFGLELSLGTGTPLNDYVTRVSLIRPEEVGGAMTDIPYLGDYSNTTGLAMSVVMILRDYEFSARFFTLPWSDTTLTHRGDHPARRITGAEIDDGGASYEPLDDEITVSSDELGPAGEFLWIMTGGVGYRYYPLEAEQQEIFGGYLEVYVPMGGGLALTHVTPGAKANIGPHLWGGIASDVSLGNWAVVLNARYNLVVTERATGIPQGATNAVSADRSVLGAMLSALHFVSCDMGLRYAFK